METLSLAQGSLTEQTDKDSDESIAGGCHGLCRSRI
jgi:hypothetical protein